MKKLFGGPGTVCGLLLRIGQCASAAASIGVMVSAAEFSIHTAFCYLIAAMGLQLLWSFGLACLDVYALRSKKDLQNPILVSLFVVGDWVTAMLSLAASCSSAGVVVLYAKDLKYCQLQGTILTQEVTLDSIQIFKTHDWFSSKPTVYFQCKGENKTVLPDVKSTNVSYSFKGEESWQPLTELNGTKCKRCGIYEDDVLTYDTFDEWELCPSDFKAEGSYTHVKEKEFNATFLCHGCSQVGAGSNKETGSEKEEKGSGMHPAVVVLIVVLALGVVAVGLTVGYKYWRKKKRQQEQARFLKLFEDGDEMEDELGLEDTL